MKHLILVVSAAAILSGPTVASAQVWDDPPGSAYQTRGLFESSGVDPYRPLYGPPYNSNRAYGAYGAYGAYNAYAYAAPGPRYTGNAYRWRW